MNSQKYHEFTKISRIPAFCIYINLSHTINNKRIENYVKEQRQVKSLSTERNGLYLTRS